MFPAPQAVVLKPVWPSGGREALCGSHWVVLQDLDERALDALKEFPVEGAVTVLKQFLESNLEHVSNKSAYLCGVMKTYRQRKQYNSKYIHCYVLRLLDFFIAFVLINDIRESMLYNFNL